MALVNENLVIDLIENQKLSKEQASSFLKERFPAKRGLSSWSVRRFCSKRSISSRVHTEKMTEVVMEASSKFSTEEFFQSLITENTTSSPAENNKKK